MRFILPVILLLAVIASACDEKKVIVDNEAIKPIKGKVDQPRVLPKGWGNDTLLGSLPDSAVQRMLDALKDRANHPLPPDEEKAGDTMKRWRPLASDTNGMDTIIDREVIIMRIGDRPITTAGEPKVIIMQPTNTQPYTQPMMLVFGLQSSNFVPGRDYWVLWLNDRYRIFSEMPGRYSMQGLRPGVYTMRIEVFPGPGYEGPIPLGGMTTFKVQ